MTQDHRYCSKVCWCTKILPWWQLQSTEEGWRRWNNHNFCEDIYCECMPENQRITSHYTQELWNSKWQVMIILKLMTQDCYTMMIIQDCICWLVVDNSRQSYKEDLMWCMLSKPSWLYRFLAEAKKEHLKWMLRAFGYLKNQSKHGIMDYGWKKTNNYSYHWGSHW